MNVSVVEAVLLSDGRCLAESDFVIHGVTDKDVAVYAPGETMAFRFRVMDGVQ